MTQKSIITLIYFFVTFLNLSGQTAFDKLNFIGIEAISTKDAISSIVQDEDGIIWIGTYGSGIYRFDGINYISYGHDFGENSSINGNIIYQLYLDEAKRLWVGTDSGLNLYNRDLDRFEEVQIKSDFGIPHYFNATNIIQDDSGDLLVSTYAYGTLKIDIDNKRAIKVLSNAASTFPALVNTFVKDKKGRILAGTNTGLYEFNEDSNTF